VVLPVSSTAVERVQPCTDGSVVPPPPPPLPLVELLLELAEPPPPPPLPDELDDAEVVAAVAGAVVSSSPQPTALLNSIAPAQPIVMKTLPMFLLMTRVGR
jgi:hypothetical protein